MKTITRSIQLFLIILGLISVSSCEKRNTDVPGTGEAEFSLNLPEGQSLKSATTDSSEVMSYHLLISVEDMLGNEILTNELVPLYQFGNSFISENVKLSTGEFNLTKFMVINPSGKVIFASPMEGSPLAYLVNKPLPINFEIKDNQVTRLRPEVLPVGNHNPGDFGYVNFGIQIIKPLHFYTVCILDNPLIMAPTRWTEAKLTVYAENGWHYSFRLQARVNHLVIRGGSEIYYFVLEKVGYETQKLKFSARELKATSPYNPLVLKIPWGNTDYKKLVLQPGPEKGKDAMISNLQPDTNFGDYKYFEATFLSESPLTVMRSNRSLIWFDMNDLPKSAVLKKVTLRLSFDRPVFWDSTGILTDSTISTSSDLWYGGVLQKIIAPWEEDSVTWNNQPTSIIDNQIYISPFRTSNVNFIDLDVTRQFLPSDNSTTIANYGMLFKLYPSEQFPGFRFASSDYDVPYMRPRLTIYYTLDL